MKDLATYLTFDGQCADAFRFYERALNGHIEMMMTNGESPIADTTPPEGRDRIMHATLRMGNRLLQGADAPAGQYSAPQGFSVAFSAESSAEAERVFAALSEGAKIRMPLQKTFWTPAFGMLTDQFGIPWMVNTHDGQSS